MTCPKIVERVAIRRICESSWHKDIELEPHERCPRCGSIGLHLPVFGEIKKHSEQIEEVQDEQEDRI